MKTLKLLSIIICSILTTSTFAQNWRLGGNTVFPGGGINSVNATNNIMGTVAGANFPIRIVTNGIQRATINNGGAATTDGYVGLADDANGFIPQERLHLFQQWGNVMTRYSNNFGGAPTGFRVGILNNGQGLLQHLDQNDIFMTTSIGQLRMFGNNPIGGEPAGMVRIGQNSGFGNILQTPRFLVAGSVVALQPNANFMVAEFRSQFNAGSSTGIKVRGSRNINGLFCAAHIDLSNWDNNENGGTEHIMARFGSDMETQSGQTGNLSIFTNNGIAPGTGLTQAAYFASNQFVGFGNENVYNITLLPTQRIDADGNARLRELPLPAFEALNPAIDQVVFVDADGVLHWRRINLAGGFGSICGAGTPAALTDNSEIQLNTFDFHFSGVGASKVENNVGIGTNCFNPLPAKLSVNQQTTDFGTTAAYVLNRDNSYPPGTSSVALFAKTTGDADPAACKSVAGWFETELTSSGTQNMAICVPLEGGVVSIGFSPKDPNTPNDEPDVCAVEQSTSLLEVNGDIFAAGITYPSDINFKTNISPITNALAKVKSLNGVYYDYDNTSYPEMNFSSDRQVGMIAQNVDTVLTEVTTYDSTLQAYTMDYARVNALLVEAIKEQDARMDNMLNKITELENCLNQSNICNSSSRTSNQGGDNNKGQTLTLQNANAIILDQNLPNPFAENTTITYVIPEDVSEATLLFYDMNGRIINQIEINERGESKLTVYGDKLEQGIYTYSLIADGKLIATKKMVKQ